MTDKTFEYFNYSGGQYYLHKIPQYFISDSNDNVLRLSFQNK